MDAAPHGNGHRKKTEQVFEELVFGQALNLPPLLGSLLF